MSGYPHRYRGKWVSNKRLKRLEKNFAQAKKLQNIESSSKNKVPEENVCATEKKEMSSANETCSSEGNERNVENVENVESIETADDVPESKIMDGRRIVELAILGRQMWCTVCKEALSLEYIENEFRRGLGSTLTVRCHKCLILNTVTTGKQHTSPEIHMNRFDVNKKLILGILSAGIGWTHVNKILGCLNIPTISFSTYKRYENEVGHLIEERAKESCTKAAGIERERTIRDVADIEKLL